MRRILEPFGVSYAGYEAGTAAGVKAVYRSVAMARLELPTGMVAAPWESLLTKSLRHNPAFIYLSFGRFSSETEAARQELRQAGFEVLESCPSEAEEADAVFATARH